MILDLIYSKVIFFQERKVRHKRLISHSKEAQQTYSRVKTKFLSQTPSLMIFQILFLAFLDVPVTTSHSCLLNINISLKGFFAMVLMTVKSLNDRGWIKINSIKEFSHQR